MEGETFKKKKFSYEGNIETGLDVFPVNADGNRTGTVVYIDTHAIQLIKDAISRRGKTQMGACRDNPPRGSLGEMMMANGYSPQVLSYVLPLLEKEGFLTHYKEGNAFLVKKTDASHEMTTASPSDNKTEADSGVPTLDVNGNINTYLEDRHPDKRYASFDYCYNYFRKYYNANRIEDIASPANIQSSCLQLGFYLASWGMLRGSSFLLQKSLSHFKPLIQEIAKLDKKYWDIDADSYTKSNIDMLMKLYEIIENSLGDDDDEIASTTLITKIMLGIFANVPALDEYFCKGFGCSKTLSPGLLRKIGEFYQAKKADFDTFEIQTLDFDTGIETSFKYTKAKLIDMVGFTEGININRAN